jgi:hypothetical protein
MEMPIDDCVWFVLPDGRVDRAIPVGKSDSRAKAWGLDLDQSGLAKRFSRWTDSYGVRLDQVGA